MHKIIKVLFKQLSDDKTLFEPLSEDEIMGLYRTFFHDVVLDNLFTYRTRFYMSKDVLPELLHTTMRLLKSLNKIIVDNDDDTCNYDFKISHDWCWRVGVIYRMPKSAHFKISVCK